MNQPTIQLGNQRYTPEKHTLNDDNSQIEQSQSFRRQPL